jgi:hypothetical protein
VVSAADPPGLILGFLDRSRYYFFQVAPQLYSRVLTRVNCIYIYMSLSCALHVNLYIFTNNGLIMTMTNDRPDLPSEGAPNIDKTVNVKHK